MIIALKDKRNQQNEVPGGIPKKQLISDVDLADFEGQEKVLV